MRTIIVKARAVFNVLNTIRTSKVISNKKIRILNSEVCISIYYIMSGNLDDKLIGKKSTSLSECMPRKDFWGDVAWKNLQWPIVGAWRAKSSNRTNEEAKVGLNLSRLQKAKISHHLSNLALESTVKEGERQMEVCHWLITNASW